MAYCDLTQGMRIKRECVCKAKVGGIIMGDSIKIIGKLEFETIYNMEIDITVNSHGSLSAEGILTEHAFEYFMKNSIIWERIQINDNDGNVLFCGVITSLGYEDERHLRHVEISGLTESWLLDQEIHNRAFQNVYMRYGTMTKYLSERVSPVWISREHDQEIASPLIQYQETDWDLLKRIGGRLHTVVVPGYFSSHYAACLGFPEMRPVVYDLEKIKDFTKKKIFINTESVTGNDGHRKGAYEHWMFSCKDNLELGDWVAQKGIQVQIFQKKVGYTNGELSFEYKAGPIASYCLNRMQNNYLKGLVLEGHVLSAQKEDIKLKLDIDIVSDMGERDYFAFPYMPESGNVFYSMPEPGTRVCLCFPDGKEEHGCVIHGKRDYLEDFPHEDRKEFRSFHKKTLCMDPDVVYMHTGGDQTDSLISINDKRKADFQSSAKIHIKAKKDINIYGRSCTVMANEHLSIKQDGTENTVEMSGAGIAFYAERHIVSAPKREGKISTVKRDFDKGSGAYMFDHVIGGIPSGPHSDYERAFLGGIPAAVSTSSDRNIYAAVGKKIRRR